MPKFKPNPSAFRMKGHKLKGPNQKKSIARKVGTPETYAAAIDAVTADMSDEQLRDIALEQHKTGKRGWDVSLKTLQQQRRSLQPKVKEEKEEVIIPPIEEETTPETKVVEQKKKYDASKDTLGYSPDHDHHVWYERSVTDPSIKGKHSTASMDRDINVKRSDLNDPEIMKFKNANRVAEGLDPISPILKRGFKMPGFGLKNK
tara:strand:- start:222 stop:830 length:609 start_codon:yes stop_codon:yes gene_type:complete